MNPLRERRRVALVKFDKTLTEQAHLKSCSMSNILNKYKKTGMLNHINNMVGKYEDYPTEMDFHSMQTQIAFAKSMFESIPSHIRAEFDNDPAKFLSFASDPENREHMLKLGFSVDHLPEKPVNPPPVDTPVEPEPEPAPEPPLEPPV